MSMYNFIKYLLTTNRKQICSDLRLYKHLIAKCRAAKKDYMDAYDAICISGGIYGYIGHSDVAKACNTYWYKDNQSMNGMDLFNIDVCDNFSETDVCKNTKCPCYERNKKYIDANNRYLSALDAKQKFFAQTVTKQK